MYKIHYVKKQSHKKILVQHIKPASKHTAKIIIETTFKMVFILPFDSHTVSYTAHKINNVQDLDRKGQGQS